MKERIKGFVIGMVTAVVLMSSFTVYGATVQKTFTATFNGIKIFINGQQIMPKDGSGNPIEPFIYNGTTYLPVRAVGEAFGQPVQWDPITASIYIGSKPVVTYSIPANVIAYQSSNYTEYKNDGSSSFSMGGVSYSAGATFTRGWINKTYAVYNFDQKFKSFSATLGHVDGTRGDSFTVNFYCDSVLKKSVLVKGDGYPEKVEFDVSGVNQLKIDISDLGSEGDPTKIGISNVVLQ